MKYINYLESIKITENINFLSLIILNKNLLIHY